MGEISKEDLAARSGVAIGFLDRLLELGLLTADVGGRFGNGDVRKARLFRSLENGGVTMESVGAIVQSGAFSFEFLDSPSWDRLGGHLSSTTYRELSADTGLDLELLRTIRESMGNARPEPEDPVREEEMEAIPVLRTVIGMGVDSAALERQVRTWGDSMRRIADSDRAFYRAQVEEPLLAAGLTWSDMLRVATEASAAMAPLIDPAMLALYHAHSEHTWIASVIEAVEATLENAGLHENAGRSPAMCFLDLSGYTRLTEERGDEAAAQMAATLAKLVQTGSHARGGRPIKWLGDGVMVHFPEPSSAVLFALQMRDEIPVADLPLPHVGIAAGPLVFQDGDYYGRTVNVAARIAAHANAGQVLASEDVVRLTTDASIEFADVGPVELRGVSRPVRLSEARRRDLTGGGSSAM
jgi:adenylate cyclase